MKGFFQIQNLFNPETLCFLNIWQLLRVTYYHDFLWSILPSLGVVTVAVVVVVVVVVVWRETTLEFNPLTFLNVAHMITDKALSNFSVQNLLLSTMVSLSSDALLISRNSMLYSTGQFVSSRCHSTRRLLQPVILTGKNPVTMSRSGVTKKN